MDIKFYQIGFLDVYKHLTGYNAFPLLFDYAEK